MYIEAVDTDPTVTTKEGFGAVVVDEVDRQIIGLLTSNARETVAKIAERVGRSRSAVAERIARLEASGVIAGYTVVRGDVRPSSPPLQAYMLLTLTGAVCAKVAPHLELIPEVKRSHSLSGHIDMILFVEVASMEQLLELREQVEAIEGVVTVTTMPVLAERFSRL